MRGFGSLGDSSGGIAISNFFFVDWCVEGLREKEGILGARW